MLAPKMTSSGLEALRNAAAAYRVRSTMASERWEVMKTPPWLAFMDRQDSQAADDHPGQGQDDGEGEQCPETCGDQRFRHIRPGKQGMQAKQGEHQIAQAMQPAPGRRTDSIPKVAGDRDHDQEVEGAGPQPDG